MARKIAILIPYFGEWPAWINFFVESCRSNSAIDWFLFNDRDPPENRTRNVRHIRTSFEDYKALLSDTLGVRLDAREPYKLCDVRPALPYVHQALVGAYDFVGFGDLDVIYGDLLSFYDDRLLADYDLLSSHPNRVSGHLCLMRNSEAVVTAFQRVSGWAKAMARPDYVAFDEIGFFKGLTGRRRGFMKPTPMREVHCFFHEAYSTPGPSGRMRWHWTDGRLTNEFYPHHPLMYLHFMSWHSNRWYKDQPGMPADAPAPWNLLENVVQMDWREARQKGFMISPEGIRAIA